MHAFQSVKKLVFDRLAEVKKAGKTSNSTPMCMWILERGELRSKSKSLAQQALLSPHSSKISDFCHRAHSLGTATGEGFVKNHHFILLFDGWRLF